MKTYIKMVNFCQMSQNIKVFEINTFFRYNFETLIIKPIHYFYIILLRSVR